MSATDDYPAPGDLRSLPIAPMPKTTVHEEVHEEAMMAATNQLRPTVQQEQGRTTTEETRPNDDGNATQQVYLIGGLFGSLCCKALPCPEALFLKCSSSEIWCSASGASLHGNVGL